MTPLSLRAGFYGQDSRRRQEGTPARARCRRCDQDLAAIIEQAVVEKLERAEARRFGKVRRPRRRLDETDTSSGLRHIPAAVRRKVYDRDGARCTFVSADGRRCRSRHGLEFHHDEPYALGGGRSPENIRLLCRAHNDFLARATYGKRIMDRCRRPALPPPELSG